MIRHSSILEVLFLRLSGILTGRLSSLVVCTQVAGGGSKNIYTIQYSLQVDTYCMTHGVLYMVLGRVLQSLLFDSRSLLPGGLVQLVTSKPSDVGT